MLADSALAGWIDYLVAPLGVLLIVVIARAASQTWGKNKTQSDDIDSVSEFLFDQPPNPRTRTPGRKGWTTQVDERLKSLDDGQLEILRNVKAFGNTIIKKQDENGTT